VNSIYSREVESDIPEPIRDHLLHADRLITCVDNNLTYRTEKALYCGQKAIEVLAKVFLIHAGVESHAVEVFEERLDSKSRQLLSSIRAGLADFSEHFPVHPYSCSKEALQREIDRHSALVYALRDLLGNVEKTMDGYFPYKVGDVILTQYGPGRIRQFEGCHVHCFVPERWGSSEAFVIVSGLFQKIQPPANPPLYLAEADPFSFYLGDALEWMCRAKTQPVSEQINRIEFIVYLRHAVVNAMLAWISHEWMDMEKLRGASEERLLAVMGKLDAEPELMRTTHAFLDALPGFREGLLGYEDICLLVTGVLDSVGKDYQGMLHIAPGDWIKWDDINLKGMVIWRSGCHFRVVSENAMIYHLGVFYSSLHPVPAPSAGHALPDSQCLHRLIWFESHPDVGWFNACQCCGGMFFDRDADESFCNLCGWDNDDGDTLKEADIRKIMKMRMVLDNLTQHDQPEDLYAGLKKVRQAVCELDECISCGEKAMRQWQTHLADIVSNLYDAKAHLLIRGG